MKIDKFLKRYDLSRKEIKEIDLRDTYMQRTPNRSTDYLLAIEKKRTHLMIFSPHTEIFSLLHQFGESWIEKVFTDTRYYKMASVLGKKDFPKKLKKIYYSIRDGYLQGKYKEKYIVVLEEPFAKSRYLRDVEDNAPEIFSGHHRVGALLALKRYNVKVVVAVDNKPGSKYSHGKIHDVCVERK
jgi:hypothetical protein